MIEPLQADEAFLADVGRSRGERSGFRLWWLGQSGFLVQWNGRHLLLDPYLSESLTKKYAATDKPHVRMTRRVVAPERLDFVDVVTSSHNHTDHLDGETLGPLRAANPGLELVIPEANRAFVAERLGCDPAWPRGLDDGLEIEAAGFRIAAVPAAHEAIDRDAGGRCHHLGYVVRFGAWSLYHPGDCIPYEGLTERLRPFGLDLALLPINGRAPERRVPGNFTGPEAARLAHDIEARLAVPCHYDMFAFNTATPDAFRAECARLGQPCRVLRGGERLADDDLPAAMSAEYDGILLGAGHNTLVLQAYLARAGLEVVCLERRDVAGGGLATVEDPQLPGFFHNTHSFFHRAIREAPWYTDLELERHEASYIEPELNVALVLKSGDALEWWTDFEKTAASVGRFSAKDAATMRSWREAFRPIVERILLPESRTPPLPPARRRALLERSPEGRLLLETSALSPLAFVEREFEHPVVRAGLLFFNGLREVDLRLEGFGHHIPMLLAAKGKAQMCRGGSAALGRALLSAVEEAGGEVRLGTTPKRIVVENGRAVGVETEDGERLRARRFVASGLNPQQTFLELLGEADLPGLWRERAASFRYNLIAPLFALNLCLEEPPRYRAAERHPQLARAFMVILGLEDFSQHAEIVRHHEAGTLAPTVMWGACPTLFDPSQAPLGHHTAFMWEKVPYRLDGDARSWEQAKDPHAQHLLAQWAEYAPNLAQATMSWFARSPLDTERTLRNMRDGDLLVGAFGHGQVGYDRPFPGAGHYRAPIESLYLCGSSSHPGGNVTGLPGYNAAQVVLADLGLPAPWAPEPIERQWARLTDA